MNQMSFSFKEKKNTLSTASTLGGKHSMIIVDTIDLVIYINSKWNTIQALIANTTTETTGMIGFSHCLQYLVTKKKIKLQQIFII